MNGNQRTDSFPYLGELLILDVSDASSSAQIPTEYQGLGWPAGPELDATSQGRGETYSATGINTLMAMMERRQMLWIVINLNVLVALAANMPKTGSDCNFKHRYHTSLKEDSSIRLAKIRFMSKFLDQ